MDRGGAHAKGLATTLENPWHVEAVPATQLSTATLLTESEVDFVQQYNHNRHDEFAEDEKQLHALQRVVPSTNVHIDKWLEKQRHCLHMRVHTDRDVARWKHTQKRMHDELVRIYDLTMSSARLHLVDRKRVGDIMGLNDQPPSREPRVSSGHNVYFPHADICVAMVVAALLAGVYGLVVVGLVLKCTHRI